MDLYAVVESLGRDPRKRYDHIYVSKLLRRAGIKPIRRNYYSADQVDKLKALYESGDLDGRKFRYNKKPTTQKESK